VQEKVKGKLCGYGGGLDLEVGSMVSGRYPVDNLGHHAGEDSSPGSVVHLLLCTRTHHGDDQPYRGGDVGVHLINEADQLNADDSPPMPD
jgi:hypothetical protein